MAGSPLTRKPAVSHPRQPVFRRTHTVKPVQISDLQRAIEAADSLADRQDLDAVPWDSTIPSTRDDDASATAPQLLQTLPGEKDRRGSKVAHDFANCFFGIRMAAEVLKRLEICEPSIRNQVLRIADSIDHDCEKGEELTDAIRRFLSESNPNDYRE